MPTSNSDPVHFRERIEFSNSFSDVDLESGKLDLDVDEKECRICHMGLENSDEREYGVPIQLGCCCKGDLAAAHKKCADTWFKIKGDMTCEICGSIALNVNSDEPNHSSVASAATQPPLGERPQLVPTETRHMWNGRRIMNFLLAGMVFAFIISWLFHFKVLQ